MVNCAIPGKVVLQFCELVQVKKLRRRPGPGTFSDSWSIDAVQLERLLSSSVSSAYWLFDEHGVVLTVPAKLLWGVGSARPLRGATFAVSHYEIRSMAIPLPQFFVDLLIGAWIGDTSERALKIARGEDDLILPRLMAELEIHWGQG
jgi:hypothetical protein